MSKRILVTSFKVKAAKDELERAFDQILSREAAEHIAQTDGMRWKIWIKSGERQQAGGVYLFDDEASARAFSEQVASKLKSIPLITDVTVEIFAIAEGPTRLTNGPVD
jgi:Putative mono-oxygenase ydhR